MDQMIGKWKMIPELTENHDAFAAAMKFPPELAAKLKETHKNVTVDMTRNGDVYSITVSDVNGEVDRLAFKLGQQFTSKGFGVESQNTLREEGDEVLGEHVMAGQATTSRRFIKDGQLIVETTGNGVTTKYVFKRY